MIGCAPPGHPPRALSEVRGWWIRDFERLELQPCDLMPVGRIWVRFAPGLWEAVDDTLSIESRTVGADTLYVRFLGTLSAPDTGHRLGSGYGHSNAYAQEIVVDRIVEVRNRRASDCSPRSPGRPEVEIEPPAG